MKVEGRAQRDFYSLAGALLVGRWCTVLDVWPR